MIVKLSFRKNISIRNSGFQYEKTNKQTYVLVSQAWIKYVDLTKMSSPQSMQISLFIGEMPLELQ